MTDRSIPHNERPMRWRDLLLFLPWVGLLAAGFQGPHAGWDMLGPVALAGCPIVLYLIIERRRAQR